MSDDPIVQGIVRKLYGDSAVTCEFPWPLLDPNEEDRELGRTHVCARASGHEGDHVCHCGERHP